MSGVEGEWSGNALCCISFQLQTQLVRSKRLLSPVDTVLILQLAAQADGLSSVELMQMFFRILKHSKVSHFWKLKSCFHLKG